MAQKKGKKPETEGKAIDKVRQAYGGARRSIEVPEWKGLALWFAPITNADMQYVDQREPKDSWERDLILLIHKAQDEDGKPLFTIGDKHYLLNEADFVVVRRVINFMFLTALAGKEGQEEARKQVAADPTSGSD